jgi:parallel beta-helix repeat protein
VPAVVAGAPAGTTFCFAAGTYALASVIVPKSGDVFDGGGRAAVLDGGNVTAAAFRAPGTDAVTIRGFTIQRFDTPLQNGAVDGFGATNWRIDNNHITLNAATAVASDTGFQVVNNLLDHNEQQGYAAHGNGYLYQGNEIAYNNEDLAVDATWEAGGGKAWDTLNGTFRGNNVHHNGGHGMWDDTNNRWITYDRNNVHDNWGAGIYHEIGYEATITNNTITGNGTATSQGGGQRLGWLWDGGIQLRSSQSMDPANPILIEGNTVTDNYNGITLLDSPAKGCTNTGLEEGRYSNGTCRLRNVLVRNNTVTMREGATGAAQDGGNGGLFTTANVKWTGNQYRTLAQHQADGHSYDWFAWDDGWVDFGRWRGDGNDLSGSWALR